MRRDAATRDQASHHRAGHSARRALGRAVLKTWGWHVAGDVPSEPRFVAIVAPHTSNWDFVVCVATMFALDLRVRWLGKHSLFRWPLGPLLRALGGRPVRRDAAHGAVAEAAEAIRAEPEFILALAPEGTRRHVDQWRTGFYHIAERAGVPIVPVVLDWSRREITIGLPIRPSGDIVHDVEALRARYRVEMALRPGGF
jgi:1-acyl-sn-glycerol-3-phosphate acyltransferase